MCHKNDKSSADILWISYEINPSEIIVKYKNQGIPNSVAITPDGILGMIIWFSVLVFALLQLMPKN